MSYIPKTDIDLQGNPTAPTASPGDSDATIATTAFVMAAVASAGGGMTEASANGLYVNVTGDTMTGRLSMSGAMIVASGGETTNTPESFRTGFFASGSTFAVRASAAGVNAFLVDQPGDASARLALTTQGLESGPGTGARDTTLRRGAASVFQLGNDDVLRCFVSPTASSDLSNKNYVDTKTWAPSALTQQGAAQYDYMKWDGTKWAPSSQETVERQVFTSASAFSPALYPGMKGVIVEVQAGGGGGGGLATPGGSAAGQAGGGGGGGYAKKFISAATLGSANVNVAVGAAGANGTSTPTDGGAGGVSYFGTHLSASGGTGGEGVTAATTTVQAGGGTGGAASGGDINISGAHGELGRSIGISSVGYWLPSGKGGGSVLSPGQMRNSNATSGGTGSTAVGYGGGGCGGATFGASTRNGGDGSAGVVIVEVVF